VAVAVDDVLVPAVVAEHGAHGPLDEQDAADDRVGRHGGIVCDASAAGKQQVVAPAARSADTANAAGPPRDEN